MIVLDPSAENESYRRDLMAFLNKLEVDATGLLSLARRVECVRFEPGETILVQGQHDRFVYFLVQGVIRIWLAAEDERRVLGDRSPVTVLGEISYFNGTPATATVEVTPQGPAILLRLSYDEFGAVIEEYPDIREALARIGEMRIISGYSGFSRYAYFMDRIGWKRDRFAVNRALFAALEYTVRTVLLPRIEPGQRLLEVGDGPGIVCQALHEMRPELLPQLHIQATYLEEAIADPHTARPSDLTRARLLRERFDHLVALQVFNVLPPERIEEQFQLAHKLLHPQGLLLIVKLPLLGLAVSAGPSKTRLTYPDLEDLLERTWPGLLNQRPMIEVKFLDADMDMMMNWNPALCEKARRGLRVPAGTAAHESAMLEALLAQARNSTFNPDEVDFHWLRWLALSQSFSLVAAEHQPDLSYFHLLLKRD